MSKREAESYNLRLLGINTVQRFMDFNIHDNPDISLEKFKSIFDSPIYENIGLAIMYQCIRDELREKLGIKE